MSAKPFLLGTFALGDDVFPAIVLGDHALDLRRFAPLAGRLGIPAQALSSIRGLLASWQHCRAGLERLAALVTSGEPLPEVRHPLAQLSVRPPFEPGQIYCTAANYTKLLVELLVQKGDDPRLEGVKGRQRELLARKLVEKRGLTGEPYLFTRPASTVIGPSDPIALPREATQVGWELELGVVIGIAARHVSRERALAHVAGYTIVNDVTQNDWIARGDFAGADWLASKGAPGSFPLGPYLLPAQFVSDPQQLHMTLRVNGEVMQDDSTSDMVLDVARQIEYLSTRVRLVPGDVIATGTPTGNSPQRGRFLQPGDVVESTIAGLGTQRNRCVLETSS